MFLAYVTRYLLGVTDDARARPSGPTRPRESQSRSRAGETGGAVPHVIFDEHAVSSQSGWRTRFGVAVSYVLEGRFLQPPVPLNMRLRLRREDVASLFIRADGQSALSAYSDSYFECSRPPAFEGYYDVTRRLRDGDPSALLAFDQRVLLSIDDVSHLEITATGRSHNFSYLESYFDTLAMPERNAYWVTRRQIAAAAVTPLAFDVEVVLSAADARQLYISETGQSALPLYADSFFERRDVGVHDRYALTRRQLFPSQ